MKETSNKKYLGDLRVQLVQSKSQTDAEGRSCPKYKILGGIYKIDIGRLDVIYEEGERVFVASVFYPWSVIAGSTARAKIQCKVYSPSRWKSVESALCGIWLPKEEV